MKKMVAKLKSSPIVKKIKKFTPLSRPGTPLYVDVLLCGRPSPRRTTVPAKRWKQNVIRFNK